MRFSTAVTGLAAATSATALFNGPIGTGNFSLQVIATGGSLIDTGDFLNPYHTGAGLNALVPSLNQTGSQQYAFDPATGAIYSQLGAYRYALSLLDPSDYGNPEGYTIMSFDAGESAGFSFGQLGGNYLIPPASNPYATFAICPADLETPGVYVNALVWRRYDAEKNCSCADVRVKAVF